MRKCRNALGLLSIMSVLVCLCGCKPSSHMGRSSRKQMQLPPQLVQKIQERYKAKTGFTIRILKVHEAFDLGDTLYLRLIVERDGKKYLIRVEVEIIDEVPVVKILPFMDKEIK